jgi:hypothetical protein
MINKLLELLDPKHVTGENRERSEMLFLIQYLASEKKYNIILDGNRESNYWLIQFLKKFGITPLFVIEDDEANDDTQEPLFFDIKKLSLSSAAEYLKLPDTIVLIDWFPGGLKIKFNNMLRNLIKYGCSKDRIHYIQTNNFEYAYWAHYLINNKEKLINFFNQLSDEESQICFIEYIRCIIEDDFYRLPGYVSSEKYFAQGLIEWSKHESFLNCGTGLGDTIFYFTDKVKDFDNIYGFESDIKTFQTAQDSIKFLPENILKKIKLYNTCISKNMSVDDILKNEPITLIGLDAEGAELEIIENFKNIIIKQKPVIAISFYHKAEDLTDIPVYIKSLLSDYKFYLRKYNPSAPYTTKDELTLYAIPPKRCLPEV